MFTDSNGNPRIGLIISSFITVVFILVVAFSSWYITPERHVDVVKTFGKAEKVVTPGLHFKMPIIQTTETIETSVRKFTKVMSVSTTGKTGKSGATELQMPSMAKISANWAAPVDKILSIYKTYGNLEQYEDRILEPKFLKIPKSVIAKYSIEDLISKRDVITNEIDAALKLAIGNELSLSDVNIEDVTFPKKIKDDIEKKQQAKLQKEAEEYALQKQNLTAQQEVNTANAKRDAKKAEADGIAYKIEVEAIAKAKAIEIEGLATAKKIKEITNAMKANPQYVELVKWQNWKGAWPSTMMTGQSSSNFLMDMRPKE